MIYGELTAPAGGTERLVGIAQSDPRPRQATVLWTLVGTVSRDGL